VKYIPLLTCQLHQSLIRQGDRLICRCQGWTDDMAHQRFFGIGSVRMAGVGGGGFSYGR
jgi:hypothetical protein